MRRPPIGMLGYDTGELIGRNFRDVLDPSSAHVAIEHFQRGLAGTESTPFFEVRVVRKDGVPTARSASRCT